MNRDTFKGQWKQFQGEMKTQWGKLTDDEWTEAEGNFEKLSGKIQERYGYAKDQAEREIDDFLARHHEPVGRV
jgi:uncharacterized protein YjbJ (UPF0337 family)